MKRHLQKHGFFVGMALMIVMGFLWPRGGALMKQWRMLDLAVFVTFVFTGLTLPSDQLLQQLRNIKGLGLALLSCFGLFPLMTWGVGRLLFAQNPEMLVGLWILAVAPVTVISGIVLTRLAQGNVAYSVLITVSTNLAAVVLSPLLLQLLMGRGDIRLPVGQMISYLLLLLVIPLAAGQGLRPRLTVWIEKARPAIKVYMQLVVLLVIYCGVASSSGRMAGLGAQLWLYIGVAIGLHGLALLMNLIVGRMSGLDLADRAAFVIHASQKSLTIAYLIWSGFFAQGEMAQPLGLIPIIAYHAIQLIIDTPIAHHYAAVTQNRKAWEEIQSQLQKSVRWPVKGCGAPDRSDRAQQRD